jgi:catechol-2,3-dioxygenase
MVAMQQWYVAVLECRVVAEAPTMVFLTYDAEHHRIALVEGQSGTSFAHLAFSHESLEELVARYTQLAEQGIVPDRATDHGITRSLYYRDPDSNWIELFADCEKTAIDPLVATPWDPRLG